MVAEFMKDIVFVPVILLFVQAGERKIIAESFGGIAVGGAAQGHIFLGIAAPGGFIERFAHHQGFFHIRHHGRILVFDKFGQGVGNFFAGVGTDPSHGDFCIQIFFAGLAVFSVTVVVPVAVEAREIHIRRQVIIGCAITVVDVKTAMGDDVAGRIVAVAVAAKQHIFDAVIFVLIDDAVAHLFRVVGPGVAGENFFGGDGINDVSATGFVIDVFREGIHQFLVADEEHVGLIVVAEVGEMISADGFRIVHDRLHPCARGFGETGVQTIFSRCRCRFDVQRDFFDVSHRLLLRHELQRNYGKYPDVVSAEFLG